MKTHRTWERTPTGAYKIEHRDLDGRLHRWGAPALILDDPGNYFRRQEHHRHGRLHNPQGPAVLCGVDLSTHADRTEFWINGTEHREGGPSSTVRSAYTGKPTREHWRRNGQLDRKDGPAVVFAEPADPQRIVVEWWRDGEPHEPSAHEKLAWAKIQYANGGPFHPEPPFAFHRELARPAKTSYRSKRFEPVL
jgi:hypothetical protein